MISLRKSATELDRLNGLQEATAECYKLALRAVAQYAIEADPKELADFREHLMTIGELWNEAGNADEYHSANASFRGEVREYRDLVHARIAQLRAEVEAGAKAVAAFAAGITSSGADHEEQLKRELSRLANSAKGDNVDEMRRAIRTAVATISASVEQIRREHQGMIAQWQDEIRMLHQEFQAERRSLFSDAASGAWNRAKADRRIEELLRQDQPFCVLLMAVHNINRLERRHAHVIFDGALKAMTRRFHALAGAEVFLGRWSREEFAAVVDVQADAAMTLSREVTRKLSGNYAVQENGISHDVELEIVAGVVERGKSADAPAFMKKLDQMSRALAQS